MRSFQGSSLQDTQLVLLSVVERFLKKVKFRNKKKSLRDKKREKNKTEVMPYIHKISHNLKKIVKQINVNMVSRHRTS